MRSGLTAAIGKQTAPQAVLLGILCAGVAVMLRLLLRSEVGGEQAIFSYPAIVIATLLFGVRAGSVASAVCFVTLWYFVIEPHHSLAVATAAGLITLVVFALVAASLVWAIGSLRSALQQYRELNEQLEEQVEHRTAERNRVWDRSRELVAIVGEDGHVGAANPALCRLLDLTGAQLAVRPFESLLVEEDRPAYLALRHGEDGAFEGRVEAKGGFAWISWSLVHENRRLYLVGRDFTAERECGEMLRQSQKMEFVGQMAGGLAHDFGNLLPPISIALHLLDRRHGEDHRSHELIGAAEESVDRAAQLIKRLLDLSRPSRLRPTVRAVEPLLEEIAPLLRQVVGPRDLRLDVEPGLPDVRVDGNQLDMALLNLVVNARDATDEHGSLVLKVARGSGETIDIAVSDDGAGMDGDTLARCTDPFFSTKASGEGSGLGLSMVHNFAIATGGRLTLRSEEHRGTTATISLPKAEDADPR